ncbi:MAG TPA: hypothetical protein PLZ99_00425 [Parcubacteria group bacterium]|nr:hypothetical protein [Parcubacteria group bacterium]
MKNSLIWAGVIVVILGLFIWRMGQDTNTSLDSTLETQEVSTTTEKVTKTQPVATKPAPVTGMKVSLGGIFAEKGNYQCDYEQATQQNRSKHVIYISNGKMRAEFRTSEGLNSDNTLMVYDGRYLYVWTEGKSTGTISEPKTIKDLPSLIPEDISSGRILGSGINNVSWNCHAWSLDKSKLVPPSYVRFN